MESEGAPIEFRNIRIRELNSAKTATTGPDRRTAKTKGNTTKKEIDAVKQKLTDYVNSRKAGKPPDKKKIDAFVNAEVRKSQQAGRLPKNVSLKMNVKVDSQGKVIGIGVGWA